VRSPDGQLLMASSRSRDGAGAAAGRSAAGVYTDTGSATRPGAGDRLRPYADGCGLALIEVSDVRSDVDVSGRGHARRAYRDVLPIMLPLMAAVLIIGVLRFAIACRRCRSWPGAAARISPTATNVRLPAAGLPPELEAHVVASTARSTLDEGSRMSASHRDAATSWHAARHPGTNLDSMENRPGRHRLRADVERMSRLVNQLLSVATLEALAVAPDEIADLQPSRGCCGMCAPRLEARPLARRHGTTAAVRCRQCRILRQALRN